MVFQCLKIIYFSLCSLFIDLVYTYLFVPEVNTNGDFEGFYFHVIYLLFIVILNYFMKIEFYFKYDER